MEAFPISLQDLSSDQKQRAQNVSRINPGE